MMLSNEERNLLVKTYMEMPDAEKIAKVYDVSVSSVYRLVRQMKDTGSVNLRTASRGRKPSLSAEDIENIRQAVIEQPDITIHEINVKLGLRVCDETVRIKVTAMNLNYKKNAPRLGTGTA
ncbi:MAG: transposase [Abditibacteriota bacterium]|nr:transposase [Abditibacteriota bacterium]